MGDVRPSHLFEIQHVAVIQVVQAVAAAEDVETAIPEARAVPVSASRGLALNLNLFPDRRLEVKAPHVVVLGPLGARASKDIELQDEGEGA